jgi:hypothetical protein
MTTSWPVCVLLRVAVLALAVFAPAIAAAQSNPSGKPLAIAGRYEGWLRGSTQGDATTVVTLAQDGTALTGTMAAGPYSFTISDGHVDGDRLAWSFSDGTISGSVAATFQAGAITGSWTAMGVESGTLELSRLPEP